MVGDLGGNAVPGPFDRIAPAAHPSQLRKRHLKEKTHKSMNANQGDEMYLAVASKINGTEPAAAGV
jgi:hypothetical protein